jgi:hypothetical protein
MNGHFLKQAEFLATEDVNGHIKIHQRVQDNT